MDVCTGKLPIPGSSLSESVEPQRQALGEKWDHGVYDIGQFLKENIIAYFASNNVPITVETRPSNHISWHVMLPIFSPSNKVPITAEHRPSNHKA